MAPTIPKDKSSKIIEARKLAPKTIAKAAARGSKTMKPIFLGKTMSFSGDFGDGWSHEQMSRWIQAHAGECVREVTKETTHLVCTIEDYKKKTPQVRKAWEFGTHCNIVTYEWLEDCLSGEPSKKRCRAEKGYTLNRTLQRVSKSLKANQSYCQSFEAGVRECHQMIDNSESNWSIYQLPLKGPKFLGLNHIYVDQTGFEYKLVCTRIHTDGKVKSEKYTIYLFESHAKPHHYMFGAKLSQRGRPPSYFKHECHPKPFKPAFKDFTRFFFEKTGIEWADRLHGVPQIKDPWKYCVPMEGRPVGFPPPAEKILDEKTSEEEEEEEEKEDSEVSDPYCSETSHKPLPRGRRSVSTVSSVSTDTISSGSGS